MGFPQVNESEIDRQFADVLGDIFGGKVSLKQAKLAQDGYQALIAKELGNGNDVSLHGFGAFRLREVPAQQGESFGHTYDNPAYRAVSFSSFGGLEKVINLVAADVPEIDEPAMDSATTE